MRIILIILLFLSTLNTHASSKDSIVNRIFNLAYNMNYELAEKLLAENKNNIDQFYFAVLEIDMSYWKNVTGTNNPNYDAFETILNKYTINQAKNFKQKGIKLIQLSYQLRYELKRFKLISAISTHKKTKILFDELKDDPQMKSIENPDLFNLYNSMFLYFSNYLNPFGGKSKEENCQLAINTMKSLSASDRIVTKTMASYILGRTFLKYEKTPSLGINLFKTLTEIYPENTKFTDLLQECKEEVN